MLYHLLRVCVFPLLICVICIKIVLRRWRHKRWYNLFVIEFDPIISLKPRMLFYFFRPTQSKPRRWLSLYQLIDKIGSFSTPSIRHFVSFDLHLLRQYMVPDFLPVFTLIRPLTKHTLVCDHAHREIVHCHSMVLAAHHLWSHITRCTWGIFRIIWVLDPCNTKISDSQVALFIKH